jgi:hypothetical protein
MKKYYAKKGEIPKQGEIWLPVGDKGHLMMMHIIDIQKVKPFIPEELDVASIGFGKTLGIVFMTSMGPESTLPYHELIIAPALIKVKCKYGFYVTHIYVDNEKSQIGGIRNFGLQKQIADFSWDWKVNEAGEISISKDSTNLITINYEKALGSVPFNVGGNAASILEDKLIFCMNSFRANYGITKVTYDIQSGSPLYRDINRIGLGNPILSVLGEKMRGVMGENTQVLAFLPNRS